MRAVRITEHGDPGSLGIEELPTPALGEDEVLVDVHAIGLNYPDLLVISGQYQSLPPLPFTPGYDAAGVVAAVGSKVSSCEPGDRVALQLKFGAYAEQLAAKATSCFVMPDDMTFQDAAAMGLPYQTAHFALLARGMYQPGEIVLVNGANGSVGLAAIQIAKSLGATVLAGIRQPQHAQLVLENGADHVIDLSADNLHDALRKQVQQVTGGHGADIVLDPLGGDIFDASLRALAWNGRMVVIGFAAGRIPSVKTNYLLVKNILVTGLQSTDYAVRHPEWVRRVQNDLFALYSAGKFKPKLAPSFSLEEFGAALALLKSGKEKGRITLITRLAQSAVV